jgi:CubicO group peptidase (beta-lactamase class C family)
MSGTAGFDPSRLARLTRHLARAVEEGTVAGAVALLWRRGETHAEVHGLQDLEGRAPMRRDTLFRIASVSKPILAAATMALLEQGRIALDAPVERWLPELAGRRVLRAPDAALDDTLPANRPITPRDLLTMRMGLGAVFGATPIGEAMAAAGVAPSAVIFNGTPENFLRRLAALPLIHQPGEAWRYHTASDVLGLLLARLAGTTLEAVLRETLLDPLGMEETRFHVPEAALGRLATAYRVPEGERALAVFDAARGGRFAAPPAFQSGGGGLVSTADDLLRFGRTLLGAGGPVLSRASLRAMATDQLTPAQKAASPFFPGFWETFGWGLGLGVVTHRSGPADNPGRFGWDGGYGTSFWCDPAEGLVGVLLTQRLWDEGFTALRDGFWALAYAALAD